MITSTSSPANCLNIGTVRTPTGWMNLFSEGHYEGGDDTDNPNHERVINTPYDRGKITPMTLKTKLKGDSKKTLPAFVLLISRLKMSLE